MPRYQSSHHHPMSKLNPEHIQKMIVLYQQGYTSSAIGKACKVDRSLWGKILKGTIRADLQPILKAIDFSSFEEYNSVTRIGWKRTEQGWKKFKRLPHNQKRMDRKSNAIHQQQAA